RAQLESSCPTDPELLRAWLEGDWAVNRGAYFAAVLEEARVAVGPFDKVPVWYGEPWYTYLAHDFGSSAPSVTYLLAESPGAKIGEQYFPKGSIVALDEYAVYRRDALNTGLGWTASKTAEALLEFCE